MKYALRVVGNLAAWILIAALVFPLIWMVLSSLKPTREISAFPPRFLPTRLSFDSYINLLTNTQFPVYFLNSVFVAIATSLIAVMFSLSGAYALTRYDFPGKAFMSRAVLFAYLLPAVILLVPLYVIVASLGLSNSLWGLVVTYTTFAMPFALWLLRAYLVALPPDVEAAAAIDGASRFEVFYEIVVPQVMPGVIATGVFTFISAYNEYLFANVFITSPQLITLPPGVLRMVRETYDVNWDVMMAAAVVVTTPVLILFALVQQKFGKGMAGGSIKG